MVDGDIVFTALNTRQQVSAVGNKNGGMHFQFLCQQFAQFDVEAGQAPVLLEAERRHVALEGNAQFAAVVHVIDQFSLSKRARQWQ